MRSPINVIKLILHPKGMAPRVLNYATWRSHFVAQLRHQIEMTADPQLEFLLREALSYPARDEASQPWTGGPGPALIHRGTTVFGSAADVTLEEVALEVMHPADAFTDAAVRAAA